MTDDDQGRIDLAAPCHRVWRFLNAWEAAPLVVLLFLGLSVPCVFVLGRPVWYMLWSSLAATGLYVFLALRELDRDEPIGVLDGEN